MKSPYAPRRLTPPAVDVSLLPELKQRLHIDFSDDDDILDALLDEATDYFDGPNGALGRCLSPQIWAQDFPSFARTLRLPFVVASVTSIAYRDADAAEQTIGAASYEVVTPFGASDVVFRPDYEFPDVDDQSAAPVTVTLSAGLGMPAAVRGAIRETARHWYDLGEPDRGSLPETARAVVRRYRVAPL